LLGRTVAHYQITDKLGEGGMGAVYRARDTKLDREVALKFLSPEVANDPERLARFRREAKVLASLNHPHIAGIFGLEEVDGEGFLVMELAEGEDLAQRLKRGPLPIDDASSIARQIALGLEEAHEKGIVHRDLKPANVMVAADGTVKILDFGLARAYADNDDGDLEHSPTITAAMTQVGTILGTAAYMSPEQAKGKPLDRRSDIWSFGVILLEMLSGRSPFQADTISETVASVLMQPIAWDSLPDETPPGLQALLERCLERDPGRRLRDIGEARIHLEDPAQSVLLGASTISGPVPVAPESSGRAGWIPWALVAALAVALLGVALRGGGGPAGEPAPLVMTAIPAPEDMEFHLSGTNPAPAAISPDGRYVVYGARGSSSAHRLWLKDLSRPETRELPDTDGGQYPFWSPDSRSIAFFANAALRILDLDTGTVRDVVPATDGKGGCWMPDGQILFAPDATGGLVRWDPSTGETTPLTSVTEGPDANSHRLPRPLGDDAFLYAARTNAGGRAGGTVVMAARLDGPLTREVVDAQTQAAYAGGYLIYQDETNLVAAPFDAASLEPTGPATTLATDVGIIQGAALGLYSVSDTGHLLYHPGYQATQIAELSWYDMDGRKRGTVPSDARVGRFQVSPDGRRVAYEMWSGSSGLADLWLFDFANGVPSRLTFDAASEECPVWAPDGRTIYYLQSRGQDRTVVALEPDTRAEPRVIRQGDELRALMDVSPDGRTLSVAAVDSLGRNYAQLMPLDPEQRPVDIDREAQGTYFATFSPDGRWISYGLLDSGRWMTYLKTNPPGQRKWQLTEERSLWHDWDPAGDRIYHQWSGTELWVTTLDLTGGTPRVGQTTVALEGFPAPVSDLHNIEVGPDGQTIYVLDSTGEVDTKPLRLIQNWTRLLESGADR